MALAGFCLVEDTTRLNVVFWNAVCWHIIASLFDLSDLVYDGQTQLFKHVEKYLAVPQKPI